MKIINKFRSKEKVELVSTHGHKAVINQNTFGVTLDCKVKVFFTRGAQAYYEFMQNPEYYQQNEIKLINIIRSPEAKLDTIDDATFEGERIYSIIIFGDIIFLMFDEE